MATSFQDNNSINNVTSLINNAITSVRAQTETFGTNSSTISTRQTFETNMINTLQTGASNLVLADQNQASANLLTEQTQQQLEISALSIAEPGEPVGAQAVQLKLFWYRLRVEAAGRKPRRFLLVRQQPRMQRSSPDAISRSADVVSLSGR